MPLVILRAPPVHFDQFGKNTYDVNGCFGSNLGTCGFGSSFSDSQQSTFTTDVNQTDSWQASATVSGGVSYAGFDVEASLQGRYGNNFSNENNSSVNTQVTVQVNANVNDYVFFRKTDYVVLEYPIYGVGRTTVGQPDAYVAVITGVDTSYAFENTSPGSTVAPSLDNIHQQGNLLSYPYYFPSGTAEPSNSIDDNPEVSPSTNGASTTSTPFPSISIGQTGSASGQDSFANQTGKPSPTLRRMAIPSRLRPDTSRKASPSRQRSKEAINTTRLTSRASLRPSARRCSSTGTPAA